MREHTEYKPTPSLIYRNSPHPLSRDYPGRDYTVFPMTREEQEALVREMLPELRRTTCANYILQFLCHHGMLTVNYSCISNEEARHILEQTGWLPKES